MLVVLSVAFVPFCLRKTFLPTEIVSLYWGTLWFNRDQSVAAITIGVVVAFVLKEELVGRSFGWSLLPERFPVGLVLELAFSRKNETVRPGFVSYDDEPQSLRIIRVLANAYLP